MGHQMLDGAHHVLFDGADRQPQLLGDGLMAIFNFPIKNQRHAAAAIAAAIDIQRRCASVLENSRSRGGNLPDQALGVGVGVHTGPVEIGEFSTFRSDFTAIGGTVNLTSRLQSHAGAGEILVSADAAADVPDRVAGSELRTLALKGIDHPTQAHVLRADRPGP